MPPFKEVVIDGSLLEGGGQLLRNAAALAAITGTPIRVHRIRAGRAKPGLAAQHVTGLQLIAAMCGGRLSGAEVGSSSIQMEAGQLRCGSYTADTKTAGSCTLLAQAALPCLLFAESDRPEAATAAEGKKDNSCCSTSLELRGGTDAEMAPPGGYLQHVLAPLLRRVLGVDLQVDLARRGFYPKGGGIMTLAAASLPLAQPLPAMDLTQRGRVSRITVSAFVAGKVPASAAQLMADAAEAELLACSSMGPAVGSLRIMKEAVQEPPGRALGDGSGLLLVAETETGCLLAASARGQRGVKAEATAAVCVAELVDVLQSGACVDGWMQDQLVVWQALAAGTSRVLCGELSLHTRTAMVIAEMLLPGVKFSVRQQQQQAAAGKVGAASSAGGGQAAGAGALWLVECQGVGLTRQMLRQ